MRKRLFLRLLYLATLNSFTPAYAQNSPTHGTESETDTDSVRLGSAIGSAVQGARINAIDLGSATTTLRQIQKGFSSQEVTVKIRVKARDPRTGAVKLDSEGKATTELVDCTVHFFMNKKQKEPPIVMIHGYSDVGNSYGQALKSIAKQGQSTQNAIWVDWPLHGRSKCPRAENFEQVCDASVRAFEGLRRMFKLPEPAAIVGHSMGGPQSAYYGERYPNAKIVMLSYPLSSYENMIRGPVEKAEKVVDNKSAIVWMKTAGDKNLPALPLTKVFGPLLGQRFVNWRAARAMRKNVQRGLPILQAFREEPESLNRLVQKTLDLDPNRVTIVVAKRDQLTPPAQLEQRVATKFAKSIYGVDSMHNIHRDHPDLVYCALVKAGVYPVNPESELNCADLGFAENFKAGQ